MAFRRVLRFSARSHLKTSWSQSRPVVRALWLFFIVPAFALGVLALWAPGPARTATTAFAPLMVVSAGVWMGRREAQAPAAAGPAGAQRAIMLVLIGALLVVVLLVKLYSR